MSGRDKVRHVAAANGWGVLYDTPTRLVVYRWLPGMVRQEVCFITDGTGRIEAVSVWENQRTSIDQETGRRERGEELLRSRPEASGEQVDPT